MAILIFTSESFIFFTTLSELTFNSSERLLIRFDNEFAINLVPLVNFDMQDIFFAIFSQFLSIHITSFSIGTVKVMYFLVFSPKPVNYFLNSSANSFMAK